MAFILLLAFITVPIIEIAVFIEVGGHIGLWSTIGVVILTAIIGTALLRQQGISVLFRIQENLEANKLPVRELFDGVCLVIAGALLLTPGFVTDAVGFLLFIPFIRSAIAVWIAARIVQNADVRFHGSATSYGPQDDTVIDGEFVDLTDTDNKGTSKNAPELENKPRKSSDDDDVNRMP